MSFNKLLILQNKNTIKIMQCEILALFQIIKNPLHFHLCCVQHTYEWYVPWYAVLGRKYLTAASQEMNPTWTDPSYFFGPPSCRVSNTKQYKDETGHSLQRQIMNRLQLILFIAPYYTPISNPNSYILISYNVFLQGLLPAIPILSWSVKSPQSSY